MVEAHAETQAGRNLWWPLLLETRDENHGFTRMNADDE